MIEVIHYQNEPTERPFEGRIAEYYAEVRELLPELPEIIKIYFSDYGILEATGVGGFAYSSDIITISLDPNFVNPEKQLTDLRPTIFHEAFHIYQGFTAEHGPFSAIENTVYEGMATIFEREYAGIFQPYGDYRKTPQEKLKNWAEKLKKIDAKEFEKEEAYSSWKFYHPELKEKWIAYRTGTWIVDQIIAKHNLTILDLKSKTATQVLELFEQ